MAAAASQEPLRSKPEIEVWFELETRCNLSCRFCYNFWKDGSAPVPSRSDTEAAIAALRNLLSNVECSQIAFSGGEPLLRPDLEEIVGSIREFRIPAVLTSNGTLLDTDRIRSLMGVGLSRFQIALHSHLAETHDMLSGGPSWTSAVKAMILVREMGATVTPVFVATRVNLHDFSKTTELCARLGLNRIIFNRFVPTGLGNKYRDSIGVPSDHELIEALAEANAVASAHSMRIQLGVPIAIPDSRMAEFTQFELTSCPVGTGQRRWTLGSDLKLRRCNQSGHNIGSVMEDGLPALLNELDATRDRKPAPQAGIRGCQILGNGLVSISRA